MKFSHSNVFLQKHAVECITPKMEPVEATESGDHLSTYAHLSPPKTPPPMRIPNFTLFDTMTSAGIYDSTISSSSNGNNKTNFHHIQNGNHHNGQHIYSSTNDYVPSSNGYWPYSTQPYFPGATRQYTINQTSSTSVPDTCSSPTEQELSYNTHGSYSHMQKMVGNYPTSYEFYQQHNTKYC